MKRLLPNNWPLLSLSPLFHRLEDDSDLTFYPYGEQKWDSPAINARETATGYEIEVAAPGMKKEDFHILFSEDSLHVSCKKEDEKEEKGEKFLRKEFSRYSFSHNISIPQGNYDAKKLKAKYTDGILHISVPKPADKVATKREIVVE